jgi:hypothetical protein
VSVTAQNWQIVLSRQGGNPNIVGGKRGAGFL